MGVIVDAVWSAALYCQRCGKLHIHDIPYFSGRCDMVSLRCGCGCQQATLERTASNQFRLQTSCVICGSTHDAFFKTKQLLRMKVEKIYCTKDNFELGYVGKRRNIEEILAFNRHEFETLHPDSVGQAENQQILLDLLNKLHDLAEQGEISCPCGCKSIAADIAGNSVILECARCGGYSVVSAKNTADLEKVNRLEHIDLLRGRYLIKNIDLD